MTYSLPARHLYTIMVDIFKKEKNLKDFIDIGANAAAILGRSNDQFIQDVYETISLDRPDLMGIWAECHVPENTTIAADIINVYVKEALMMIYRS